MNTPEDGSPRVQAAGTALVLLGPPASGKSTLNRTLRGTGARVFRLREYAQRLAEQHSELATAERDALGWFSDDLAARLVEHAVTTDFRPSNSSLVVFEGYPGNAVQVHHLLQLLDRLGAAVTVVLLELPHTLASRRAAERRVCPTCSHAEAEPHQPAALNDKGACAHCGGTVHPRDSDTPARFAARSERFHAHLPQILHAFQATDTSVLGLDAGRPTDEVLASVVSRLGSPNSLGVHR